MSNIPRARAELLKMAEMLESGKATPKSVAQAMRKTVQDDLVRRSPARKMPRKSAPITPARKQKIIELLGTDLHSAEIAAEVGVNPGRVSEVLQGDK